MTIKIRGARQNSLKNLSLDLPANELIVITGVSGSGKSSLAFDTLFAEGQRRYVETFSPYARQFLDRMDKPAVDRIEGIPPSIAIDQTNPVRTSRSTVGTLTELTDHFKLLFAKASHLHCGECGRNVEPDHAEQVAQRVLAEHAEQRCEIQFDVKVPDNFDADEIQHWLDSQGYARSEVLENHVVRVTQDRLKLSTARQDRLVEALEIALHRGHGEAWLKLDDQLQRVSTDLSCQCGTRYSPPTQSVFSFNSPLGACDDCRGFGRVIGIDYGLVIPDHNLSIRDGAIKPFQTESNAVCQRDLMKYAKAEGIDVDCPWGELDDDTQRWVIDGAGGWNSKKWYGVARFFEWLEGRSYKMHVRVLLSRYRSYSACPTCAGARFKSSSLLWRIGSEENAKQVLEASRRFLPSGLKIDRAQLERWPGLHLHDLMQLPLVKLKTFIDALKFDGAMAAGTEQLLTEIRRRLSFLVDVGLGYLNLDRQSRTLSGGEVQRINLTTALGTSLVNTLFVLDEPSIGLHPRDIDRVVGVMQKLRDQGNTLVVVEHDPQIMLAANRIIDMGPGAGERGGEIIFNDVPAKLLTHPSSVTAQFLRRERRVDHGLSSRPVGHKTPKLTLRGARENNLQSVDLTLPLGHFICVTGVSGSGKSTLIHDTLYMAIKQQLGEPVEAPGAFESLEGMTHIGRVELIDQSPIGRTTRSTAATYTGAFEAIRKIFAKLPQSLERGYKLGTFSFSSGLRCPTCSGNGFEHVEMQFLSDVYLRCASCDGKRYTDELLEVVYTGADGRVCNIADVLALSVNEAMAVFADEKTIIKALKPLIDVGLDYVQLGQAVTTLSGGEAQRLKLAGHLAKMRDLKEPTLFLFDEPTTGLHFADTEKLLSSFDPLLEAGHTVLVIEHNLDVIQAADWIIDLGPEGGDQGGQIVFAGTVADIKQHADNHTGKSLVDYDAASLSIAEASPAQYQTNPAITVHGAREHNLKDIDVRIPREGMTVITGLSGSGKSTLAFDIVFNEGQRRYLESLNAYARQFVQPASKADVDAVRGLPPTVAIEQRTSRGGRKSTVATQTELYHFMRLLYVTLGTQYCPDCDVAIEAQSLAQVSADVLKRFKGKTVQLLAPLVRARKGIYKDLAAWAAKKGYSQLRVDGEWVPTDPFPVLDRYNDHNIELLVGEVTVNATEQHSLDALLALCDKLGNHTLIVASNGKDQLYSTTRACPSCQRSFDELDPRLFSYNSALGWCTSCYGTGERVKLQKARREPGDPNDESMLKNTANGACKACDGARLNPVARAVRWQSHSLVDLTANSVAQTAALFDGLSLKGREAAIARDTVNEIKTRLHFLQKVGLGYLSLNRAAPTLSGGEAQRIRLAAQLGSNLEGVTYVLDEPTIGLHPADNEILLGALRELADHGNTVIVVEHDEDTIQQADHIIDMGPGAGIRGGEVVASGTLKQLLKHPHSPTAKAINAPLQHPLREQSRPLDQGHISIKGARANNLQNVDIDIPLHALVGVAGVSGSGKSTLIRRVLKNNLENGLHTGRDDSKIDCKVVSGISQIERLLEVDQTPIGKTPRSCPATYIGIWDDIRKAFANTTEAQVRGYSTARFSFNTGQGRCPVCEGQGMQTLEMNFLPDVKVLCEQCNGLRFNRETLAVTFKGKSVGEVLAMEVDDAVEFFAAHPKIHYALSLLQQVGLGYLTLGQPSPTLSGGEAQRIKLVTELSKARPNLRGAKPPHTLYLLDEPTVGLHMLDVARLINVLHDLVDAGHSVIVIEHNLDVLAECDQLIEMGPAGGDQGGQLILQGQPLALKHRDSPTAKRLPF